MNGHAKNGYKCVCGDTHKSDRTIIKYDIVDNILFGFCR